MKADEKTLATKLSSRFVEIKGNLSGTKFAEKCGIPQTVMAGYLRADNLIGLQKLLQIANANNVSLDSLVGRDSEEGVAEDYCQIKLYDVQGSAGPGAYVENEMVVDVLSFREKWIRNELNCDPKQLTMIFVTGDSMEPTLHSGDVVLIDHSAVGRVTDAIWVIGVEEGPLVKRVQVLPGAKARIISDNKTYETWDVDLKDLPEGMRFIGRVVWSGRRM